MFSILKQLISIVCVTDVSLTTYFIVLSSNYTLSIHFGKKNRFTTISYVFFPSEVREHCIVDTDI